MVEVAWPAPRVKASRTRADAIVRGVENKMASWVRGGDQSGSGGGADNQSLAYVTTLVYHIMTCR